MFDQDTLRFEIVKALDLALDSRINFFTMINSGDKDRKFDQLDAQIAFACYINYVKVQALGELYLNHFGPDERIKDLTRLIGEKEIDKLQRALLMVGSDVTDKAWSY